MTNEEALKHYKEQLSKAKSEYRKRDILRAMARVNRKKKIDERNKSNQVPTK